MRIPIILGFALGSGAILASEYAFPKDGLSWRSSDPDLLALEKLNQRAKKAVDAFVLRPRISDGYDAVCHGCLPVVATAPPLRIQRISVASGALETAALRAGTGLPAKPKFVTLTKHPRHALGLRQKLARRLHRLKHRVKRVVMPRPAVSWEAELRR